MVKEMQHATGVILRSPVCLTEHRDPDIYGMARPSRIFTTNADANWDSGTFTYGGAGNITAMVTRNQKPSQSRRSAVLAGCGWSWSISRSGVFRKGVTGTFG
ncbi:MAG TPA: hypothetical protein ENK19_04885 [Acidobacteria bacterium]|nr:hypothetical protein [Acidobacteriota bacterium]